ncbi:MAG: hypothetical protein UR69_C0001G0031 [Candidatus Moranbacteria bacterium GW2011_GWE2_35_2-]|nr:MAG: hypothetical protein UR69_C0001G0031 [Candidatus Moranbacteria bacterium GW2011_GWE2_35_2-]KKQ05202.1 MAG: hypothetical protein US15_C0033G0002 [Candidatus Moranbacteria bacterium GW2011_GWF1_36_4]KKQ22971.1 MAG: hypothetical protein US37_C0001G0243 [Candidatus Moranbacteria bacterium GW2011_GWF2_37_11]KKQ29329.1 MAG: hypothetical protein US44_C0002G0111 [Candidatus Moranbacteria bacterium GW2011_GWD1_37_17]KKQ30798.1 MAG: hypothetical protein US47_C0001G0031 [Candidatus Moranbacteria b
MRTCKFGLVVGLWYDFCIIKCTYFEIKNNMELKRYIEIFRKNIWFFLMTVFVFLIAGVIYYVYTPEKYVAAMDLNITRVGQAENKEYDYDGFYRLQADEKFAETIVWWLKSPRIVKEICRLAEISQCSAVYDAKKLSSQYLQVNFSVKNSENAEKIARSLVEVIGSETSNLNLKQKKVDWFEVQGNLPDVQKVKINLEKLLIGAFLLGCFFGFWVVLGRHYFDKNV